MKPRDFLKKLDDAKIVRAIREAERKTSGEIRIFITSQHLGSENVVQRAATRFEKLGMTATRDRNAVLLYFAPRSNQFAIVGDTAVHEKCGDTLWHEVVSAVSRGLRESHFTEAVLMGIALAGDALAHHFPPPSDDRNELPNKIERD